VRSRRDLTMLFKGENMRITNADLIRIATLLVVMGLVPSALGKSSSSLTIVPQRHLTPGANTLDIPSSRELGPFKNQRAIYDYLVGEQKKKGKITVIVEGCQESLNEIDKEKMYGWSNKALAAIKENDSFADALAHVGQKLKVKLGDKVQIICGDTKALVKKNLLALSEVRAFIGIYSRLLQYKGKDKKKYDAYAGLIYKDVGSTKVDALKVSKEKAIEAIAEFERILNERNRRFIETARKHRNESPYMVIGGLHIPHLQAELNSQGQQATVKRLQGYEQSDEKLLATLRKELGLKPGEDCAPKDKKKRKSIISDEKCKE
jgi:hypothetical protein